MQLQTQINTILQWNYMKIHNINSITNFILVVMKLMVGDSLLAWQIAN